MATLSTTTGTYLSDLFDPEVVGDTINNKLFDRIVFAPLAFTDNTLRGRPGDTITMPYYEKLGDAELVAEGNDIPIKKLTQKTKTVKVEKWGLGVIITDEGEINAYKNPMDEAVNQIVSAIASKVDDRLLTEMNGNTKNVYTPSSTFSPADIPKALALFGEEMEGQKALIVDAETYAGLMDVKSYMPSSEIAANILIRGAVGMVYGCQVIVSDRVKGGNFHIVKPGALAIFSKREVLVEFDRDIVNQTNVMTGTKIFAPYLYKPDQAIVIKKSGS